MLFFNAWGTEEGLYINVTVRRSMVGYDMMVGNTSSKAASVHIGALLNRRAITSAQTLIRVHTPFSVGADALSSPSLKCIKY